MKSGSETFCVESGVEQIFASSSPGDHFFGYYDKSPFDSAGTRVLALRTEVQGRLPDANDSAEVGYFNINRSEFVRIGVTRCFNWQQGCMLQWLGPDFDKHVLYNDFRAGIYCAVIIDTATNEERVIPSPVYAVSPDGRTAVSVNFARHYWCRRGYSYSNIVDEGLRGCVVPGDGLSLVDLASARVVSLITTKSVTEDHALPSMMSTENYLEHAMFNPGGTRFAFYHRWLTADGGIFTRLYSSNLEGEFRKILDTGRLTHFTWQDDETLLVYGIQNRGLYSLRRSKWISRCLKPFIPLHRSVFSRGTQIRKTLIKEHFFLVDVRRPGHCFWPSSEFITEDGHPSFSPVDSTLILTDTYEDKDFYRHVYLFSLLTGRKPLGRFYSPLNRSVGPVRCDLHPRWSRQGDKICIDSLHNGTRQIYVFDVSQLNPLRHSEQEEDEVLDSSRVIQ